MAYRQIEFPREKLLLTEEIALDDNDDDDNDDDDNDTVSMHDNVFTHLFYLAGKQHVLLHLSFQQLYNFFNGSGLRHVCHGTETGDPVVGILPS